ncbi:MAG: hypothetical protein AB8B53_02635 [Flavobacteriales bacterium]
MKKLGFILFALCLLVLFSRCNREKTTWYPEFAAPLAYGTLSAFDIEENDYLNLDDDVIKVHYYDTLAPLDLTEVVDLGDTILEAAYSLGFPFGPIPIENGNTIVSLSEDFRFNLDDAQLRSGKIRSGLLRVEFESNVDGYLDLSYTLPGILLNNEPLGISALTDPATTEEPYTEEFFVDVSGYSLDFTGLGGDERNTLYGELSIATAQAPAYVAQVFGTDSVRVKMELLEIEVQELRGYFGQFEREVDEIITLDSVFYQGGSISLSEIEVNLEFINNFGIDAEFEISDLAAVNSISEEELTLTATSLYNQFNVPRAIETPDGVIPNSFEFNFDETSNLAEVISVTPNQFRLQADATLNPLGDISGGFDFYLDRYPFQMVTDVQFPLCLGIENLTLSDTLDVDIDEVDNIEHIKLFIHLDNEFPVGFNFSISFENEADPLFTGDLLSATEAGLSIPDVLELDLSDEQLARLTEATYLLVSATANTNGEEEVKFLTSQEIEIRITAEITYEASL